MKVQYQPNQHECSFLRHKSAQMKSKNSRLQVPVLKSLVDTYLMFFCDLISVT